MDLLSEVDSKLFAKCKSEGHCLHHMLPPSHQSSHVLMLWFCILTVMTTMSLELLMMRCLYGQKTVCCGSVV